MFGQSKPFGNTFGQQNTSGGFGASGGFGTPASGGIFGGATSTPASTGGGLFGGSSAFGQTSQQQNTGFSFGQQSSTTNTGGSLFGGTATSTAGGLFATPSSSSAFGAKTPGGFGGNTSQGGGLFGTTSTSGNSLFGGTSTTASSGGGLFSGGFGAVSGQNGSAVAKFNAPTGNDTMLKGGVTQNINTRHQCITAMKEYESKSLEEIRAEDYLANRKGPQAGSTAAAGGGGGLFGSAGAASGASTGGFGGFGATNTQNKTGFSLTGTTSTSGGLFGNTSTSGGGLFSQSNQPKPLFGSTTTTASSTGFGGFGTTNTSAGGGLFGATNQPKPGGLFGATSTPQATNSIFGQTQQTSAGGFGGFGQQQNTTSLFGQPQQQASGGLFGAAKPAFGATPATASTTGFNFGAPTTANTGGGLFGAAKPATTSSGFSFGGGNTGFGAAASTGGGLFGAKPATTGFGATSIGGFGTGGTLGGNTLGGTTSLFGNNNKPTGLSLGGTNFGGGGNTFGGLGTANTGPVGFGGNTTLGAPTNNDAAAPPQLQQVLTALANSPYGDNSLFKNIKQDESRRQELLKPTNPAAQKAALQASSQYKVSPRPTAKIKPKPLHSIANGKSQLFDGLEDEDNSSFGNDSFVPRRSIKKLVIKGGLNQSQSLSSADMPSPKIALDDSKLAEQSPMMSSTKYPDSLSKSNESSRRPSSKGDSPASRLSTGGTPASLQSKSGDTSGSARPTQALGASFDDTIAELNLRKNLQVRQALEESRLDMTLDTTHDDYSQGSGTPPPPHPTGIILHRPGYYTMPNLDDLADCMDENGDCYVENFVIGREGYGNVLFPGVTNVAGLKLDEIVHFRRKEINVYPDDESKPDEGKGLNKKAQVCLDCVWPTDKSTRLPIKSVERLRELGYQDRLERASAKIGAKFIDYMPETGSWVFEVKHFSKYGLDDSDEEDELPDLDKLKQQQQKQQLELLQKQKLQKQQEEKKAMQEKEHEDQKKMELSKPVIQYGLQPEPMAEEDNEVEEESMDDIMKEGFPEGIAEDSDNMDEQETLPTSHQLAIGLGVQAHDLQVRKASFFGDEDEDMDNYGYGFKSRLGALGGGFIGSTIKEDRSPDMLKSMSKTKGEPWLGDRSLFRTSFRGSTARETPKKMATQVPPFLNTSSHDTSFNQKPKPHAVDHPVIPSGMAGKSQPKRKLGNRINKSIPALKESFLFDKQHCILDQALFMSRTFRLGWAPNWTASHPGIPILQQNQENKLEQKSNSTQFSLLPFTTGKSQKKRLGESSYQISIETVHMTPYVGGKDNSSLMSLLEGCLEIQLQNSSSCKDFTCPQFVPTPGVEALHQYADLLQQEKGNCAPDDLLTVEQMSVVWELCVALWGDLPELSVADGDTDSYVYRLVRREALSKWLSDTVFDRITEEVSNNRHKGEKDITTVFSYLTGRQIAEACSRAQDVSDHRLAMLIAQVHGSDIVRNMLKKQLQQWHENKVDEHITPERLKVYALIAGYMVWESNSAIINTCEDLDWKRCLALHLWYSCPPSATIAEAFDQYTKAFQGSAQYSAKPLPPYLENEGECGEDIQDMCYHLLKLYCDRSHELHSLLNPSTSTPNHLDYRLSWHLMCVISALQYSHLSQYHHAALCCSYASQLESLGLWNWAIFVLLHLQNNSQREGAVKEVLMRHVTIESDQAREQFVRDRLFVPAAWIHHAKAVRAQEENQPHHMAWHLLRAERWNESHQVVLKNVAADSIINENYDYLKQLLVELGSSEVYIKDWDIGGKVFLDYINMMQTLEMLKQGQPSVYELEKLQPEVASLASRISLLTCSNAKDRLCQAEMAKRMAILNRTLASMQTEEGEIDHSARLLAPVISQLPLPEDYALQELRQLTRSHMLEVTMS